MDRPGLVSHDPSAASFRDPSGRLLTIDGKIIRVVNKAGVPDLEAFLASNTVSRFRQTGRVVGTRVLDDSEAKSLLENEEFSRVNQGAEGTLVLEHEPIPFPSYPYEWPPEMLHSACALTLDLADSLLAEGMGLKDATPYNILFRGPEPIFVDLLSFEKRAPGDPIWLANAQMERTFLLPLLVNREFGIPLDQILTVRRDGLEPEDVYRLCGRLRRLAPGFLTLVTLPVWLAARHNQDDLSIYTPRSLDNVEKARFIIQSLFRSMRRKLKRVSPRRGRESAWSDYMDANNNYSEEHFRAKNDFVEKALAKLNPRRVLDVGANTGHFSALAARRGAEVVAIDYDEVVVGEIWRRAKAEKLDILPLVVNLARPTPAVGWRNRECASFLDRARAAFDAVLMLAVVHHMLVSERIPLAEIIDLASELTTDLAIIEFISPEDSMFRRLSRGRDHLFLDLTRERFEDVCKARFEIAGCQHLDKTSRWLYLLRKKGTIEC